MQRGSGQGRIHTRICSRLHHDAKNCNEAARENPAAFFLVPDRFKTQKMCIRALELEPWQLYNIPDYFKTQKM